MDQLRPYRSYVSYIDRSREFYAAQGYTRPYAWPHYDDVDSFLPVNHLAEYAAGRRIGSASPRFYGVPTDYSQGRTIEHAAPRILEWCREALARQGEERRHRQAEAKAGR